MRILVSAGETSGDRYAAELVAALRKRLPDAEFFGAAGPRMRAAGVEPIIRSESLAVVGLAEVVSHIPRIYGEFRKLIAACDALQPDLAILTDSPDFHIRVAAKLHARGVPVVHYIAPQFWAWRPWRVKRFRRLVDLLLCIFPFEESWFGERGVETRFVGHPLANGPTISQTREQLFARYGLDPELPLVAILPGSRQGEATRNLPDLMDGVARLDAQRRLNFALAASNTTGAEFFRQRISVKNVRIVGNDTRDLLGHTDLALVASGTATVEAALLGAPMVVYYRVSTPTWLLGKMLVTTPYYSMVNLLAGRAVVTELIQKDFRGDRLAAEALRLLDDPDARESMRADLAEVRGLLTTDFPAAEKAAETICARFELR